MFTGLTSQVTNWMGKKQEDEIPTPEMQEQPAIPSPVLDDNIAASDSDKKDISPTKAGGRFDVLGNFGNVKSQMSGWLGGGIPGLRKGETDPSGAGLGENIEGATTVDNTTTEKSKESSSVEKVEEDENSSDTGGADSEGHVSEEGTPIDDKDGQQAFGAVTTKALAGAKSIGGFFFSAVNKAGKTVTEASAKIKKTVEENSILGEFNKEQEQFIKEKQGKGDEEAVPPWAGYPNEDALKEECLSLSSDRRNFVRSPPAGVDFQFDYEVSYPIAMATLAEDPNLEKMRFELVPKVINEENFWRNYFYRVSLICQASELNSMAQEGDSLKNSFDASRDKTANNSAEETNETKSPSTGNINTTKLVVSDGNASAVRTVISEDKAPDSPLHEFVSDTFTATSQDILEVEQNMKKLGITDDTSTKTAPSSNA